MNIEKQIMFDLKNKIAVVTGAGGFLGKNFCKFL